MKALAKKYATDYPVGSASESDIKCLARSLAGPGAALPVLLIRDRTNKSHILTGSVSRKRIATLVQ